MRFAGEVCRINSYKENLYRFPLSLSVHLIESRRHINDVMAIESQCFPEAMQYSKQDFESFFRSEHSTGLILCHDGQPIGYFAGTDLCEDNVGDLLLSDPFISRVADETLYLESIAIVPKHRSLLTLDFLAHEMAALVKGYDYKYAVGHIRKKHGLPQLVQRRFEGRILKTYDEWQNYGEAFEFFVLDLNQIPTLTKFWDHTFHFLRILRSKLKHIPWYE